MNEIQPKKCGLKFSPPAVILTYSTSSSTKFRRRMMPLHGFTKTSSIETAATELRTCERHQKYLEKIPVRQLERIISIIRDKLNGMALSASLAKNKQQETINPDEDLNQVDEETLRKKKNVMNDMFEENRVKPTDAGFEYDIEVDFGDGGGDGEEVEGWDSDGDSDPDF